MELERRVEILEMKIDTLLKGKGKYHILVNPKSSRTPVIKVYEKPGVTEENENPRQFIEHEKEIISKKLKKPEDDEEKTEKQWKIIKNEENNKIFEYAGHKINIFTNKGIEYANMDEGNNIKLKGGLKSMEQIEKMKREIEEKWM